MTKNDFLKTYKEVMGVELTWCDLLCGIVLILLFVGYCSLGEIF